MTHTFSAAKFRNQFPLFSAPENRDLVYLDNAATTQKPRAVIDAISYFYGHQNANTHRSSHRLARAATAMVEETRQAAATFLNATSPREVIFCRGATEGLNLLANSLGEELERGDEIVVSTIEHHANLVPWQMLARRKGLNLRFVPHTAGVPEFDRLHEVLGARTRIVSLSGGSNALGVRPDFDMIRDQLQGLNLRWIVDGAQLAAHEVVDVQAMGCDFLVCSAHKFYGPTGVGLLYGREQLLERMAPWQGGGEMIQQVGLQESTFAGLPHRFEAGTSSLAGLAGLRALFKFLDEQDRAGIQRHEQQLLSRLHAGVASMRGWALYSQTRHNLGIAALAPREGSVADLAQWLDGREIAVRTGHHCAQPLMQESGAGATLRASVCAYNTEQDIDQFLQALEEYGAEERVIAGIPHTAVDAEVQSLEGVWRSDTLDALRLEQLAAQRNWQDRYRELMRWGKHIQPKLQIRIAENLVHGCESAAWLLHRREGSLNRFVLDSDSRVVKGLGALLLILVNGRSTQEIDALDLKKIFSDLGLDAHLSVSRSNGFYALVRRVRALSGCPVGD